MKLKSRTLFTYLILPALALAPNSVMADYAGSKYEECNYIDTQSTREMCQRLKVVEGYEGDIDCVSCLFQQRPEPPSTAAMLGSQAISAIAYVLPSYFGYKSQKSWAGAYKDVNVNAQNQCTSRYNGMIDHNVATGSDPLMPDALQSFSDSCLYAGGGWGGFGQYPGFGGGWSDGYGGWGNPYLSNGWSSGFLGGMAGPNFYMSGGGGMGGPGSFGGGFGMGLGMGVANGLFGMMGNPYGNGGANFGFSVGANAGMGSPFGNPYGMAGLYGMHGNPYGYGNAGWGGHGSIPGMGGWGSPFGNGGAGVNFGFNMGAGGSPFGPGWNGNAGWGGHGSIPGMGGWGSPWGNGGAGVNFGINMGAGSGAGGPWGWNGGGGPGWNGNAGWGGHGSIPGGPGWNGNAGWNGGGNTATCMALTPQCMGSNYPNGSINGNGSWNANMGINGANPWMNGQGSMWNNGGGWHQQQQQQMQYWQQQQQQMQAQAQYRAEAQSQAAGVYDRQQGFAAGQQFQNQALLENYYQAGADLQQSMNANRYYGGSYNGMGVMGGNANYGIGGLGFQFSVGANAGVGAGANNGYYW